MTFRAYLRDDKKWSVQGGYFLYPFLAFDNSTDAQHAAELLNQTYRNGQEEVREEFRTLFRNIIGYEETK